MFCWYAREKWGVSSAWWHVKTALRFSLWDQCQEGSVYGVLSKRCEGCLKAINWGWRCKSQKGALLIGKAGFHCVILLHCETLLQVFLGIHCKRFYWIPLFTILLLFYVFEVGKTKNATQSILIILTLNGLFQKKKIKFFTLALEIPDKTRLHPQKLHIIVLHPSETLRPKAKSPGNFT